MDFRQEFIDFALGCKVLRFGEFTTKAGRLSPYFFNAGLFNDGQSLARLAEFYAKAAEAGGVDFDMLFGPAYKGIPLVAGTAIRLAEDGVDLPFAFNRKEAKDHGEGGTLIGAPLRGKVLILDDVISAGTSVRESVELIRAAGADEFGILGTAHPLDGVDCRVNGVDSHLGARHTERHECAVDLAECSREKSVVNAVGSVDDDGDPGDRLVLTWQDESGKCARSA